MRAPITLLVVAATLALPGTAAAADGTLSKDAPTFAWDGGPGSGHAVSTPEGAVGTFIFGCGAPVPNFYDCEATLLEVKEKGDLKVAIDAASEDSDLDLYLFKSNAEGEYDETEDEPIAMQADGETDESVKVAGIEPGFYVAHVEFWSGLQETYKGSAEMSGFPVETQPVTPVVAPPAPPAQTQQAPPPPPPAQPVAAKKKPSKRAACMKKAKKVKKAKARKRAVKKCKRIKA